VNFGQEKNIKVDSNKKGSITLELVFSITILMAVFLGFLTFSLIFSDYHDVQKVAREGARESVITGDQGRGVAKAYETAWLWGLDPGSLSVVIYRDSTGNSVIDTCVVEYTTKPFSKTFPTLLKGRPLDDIKLYGRATFRQ